MIKFHLIKGHWTDNESSAFLGNELHSELIQALIHSKSDLRSCQLKTCSARLDDIQRRLPWRGAVGIYVFAAGTRPSPSFPEELAHLSQHRQEIQKKKKNLNFLGLARHQSHWLRYQRRFLKSSELCCSTGCYLLLSALSQWIEVHFSKQISCSAFELPVSSSVLSWHTSTWERSCLLSCRS